MYRRLALGAALRGGLLVLAGAGGGEEKKPAVYGTVRLGSWNIEHLGDPKARRGSGEGFQQKPEDLARAALFLASDEAAMVTGSVFPVDGGRCI